MDTKVGQKADESIEDPFTCGSNPPADRRLFHGSIHEPSSCIVVKLKISNVRVPDGILTSTVSPSRLFSRLRPIGDVVEISPCTTFASSLVTSLYVIFSSLSTSSNSTFEPSEIRSRGILSKLMRDKS